MSPSAAGMLLIANADDLYSAHRLPQRHLLIAGAAATAVGAIRTPLQEPAARRIPASAPARSAGPIQVKQLPCVTLYRVARCTSCETGAVIRTALPHG